MEKSGRWYDVYRVDVLQADGIFKREQRWQPLGLVSEQSQRAAWRQFQPYLDRVNDAAMKLPPKAGLTLAEFVEEWRTSVAVNLKGSTTRAAVDGNDNVWISNFAGASGQLAHLCGVRTENCPPGMKTGDPISPPLGYVGGGLQMEVDVDVDPAGNVWVTNNWQDIDSCVGTPIEGLSTRCAGQGIVVFYGMAKPVSVPLIGPAHQP